MNHNTFKQAVQQLFEKHQAFLDKPNEELPSENGIFSRFRHPILTDRHAPVEWRYDLNETTNPHLLERMGINAAFNAGAIEIDGKIALAVRVEGNDRKSFFAIAESKSGVDKFRFREYPIIMPENENPDVNVYDMRLTRHEDGWIYGVFCTERKDPNAAPGDLSSAVAQAGIARTKDLDHWDRLPDLKTPSPQQRNVVLHPEFVNGQYAFYTRPQDDFIQAGSGGGIGWGLARDINHPVIEKETVIEQRAYHTIKESKNGLGPAPIKTPQGWLHLAHGVRGCAAGLRYVLYVFMTDLYDPTKIIYQPGGYFLAPKYNERIGDVSNVVFSNGWVARDNGELLIYYGSSDTRMHVARSTIDKVVDYAINTPQDGGRSYACVQQRIQLIDHNKKLK